MVLLKSPVSPSRWPVAIADALAVVKVGNKECEFLKLTPLSRISAIVGAVCGVTIRPRRPSGTNRIRLWGVLFGADLCCAEARPVESTVRPADSSTSERRITVPPEVANERHIRHSSV